MRAKTRQDEQRSKWLTESSTADDDLPLIRPRWCISTQYIHRCVNLLISAYYLLFGASRCLVLCHIKLVTTTQATDISRGSARFRTSQQRMGRDALRPEQGLTTTTTKTPVGGTNDAKLKLKDTLSGTNLSYTHIINNISIICFLPLHESISHNCQWRWSLIASIVCRRYWRDACTLWFGQWHLWSSADLLWHLMGMSNLLN